MFISVFYAAQLTCGIASPSICHRDTSVGVGFLRDESDTAGAPAGRPSQRSDNRNSSSDAVSPAVSHFCCLNCDVCRCCGFFQMQVVIEVASTISCVFGVSIYLFSHFWEGCSCVFFGI